MKSKILALIICCLASINTYSQKKNSQANQTSDEKYQAHKKETREQLDGSILKELSFEDIDGHTHTLKSLQGKVVVLHFWFIQCKPCIKEFPNLNKLKARFKDQPVAFFAVTWNDKQSTIKFLESHKLDLTTVPSLFPQEKLIRKFEVPYYPYNIIIDQKGKVEYVDDKFGLSTLKRVERRINTLLQ